MILLYESNLRGLILMKKRLDIYFFGDTGEYDSLNPSFVCSMPFAGEILYLIAAHKPCSISTQDISKSLSVDLDTVAGTANALVSINAVEREGNTYRIRFPVFLKEDIAGLKPALKETYEFIGKAVERLKNSIISVISALECYTLFGVDRLLYHIICDSVFDGLAFDFFEERGLFCCSKPQPGNRDYIMIGYEDCYEAREISRKLLCSSNNYTCDRVRYNSFGDSDGYRKDIFRLARIYEGNRDMLEGILGNATLSSSILGAGLENVLPACSELLINLIESNGNGWGRFDSVEYALLKETGYIGGTKERPAISVPVFYEAERPIIKTVSDMVLNEICPEISRTFQSFYSRERDFSAVRCGVDMKELGNELWHQLFCFANEYLTARKTVQPPAFKAGCGRYLQSCEILT